MIFQNLQDRRDANLPEGGGRPSHRRHVHHLPDVLDVVAVVSNPVRFRARYDLFRAFESHIQEAGARLTLVECAFGNRPFEVTSADNPRHVQVRTSHEFWIKENLINLGIARLPQDARYIAWVDADVTFVRHDWVQETLQQLQHYPIVQMFSEAHDLDPEGHLLNSFRSFGYSHVHGIPRKPGSGYYGGTPSGLGNNPRIGYWHHPGFAWAARREAIDAMGGLFDVGVVGESDFIMAKALVGEADEVLYPGVSAAYRKATADWQVRALTLRSNFGYVAGTIMHHWHGSKAGRNYWNRCKILTDSQFDPTTDLKRDTQGIYQLVDDGTPRSILLRDALRAYFRNRNEDSDAIGPAIYGKA